MKVNLKVKENNQVETIQHEVEELNLFQVTKTINIIGDLFKLTEKDDKIKGLFDELFDPRNMDMGEVEESEEGENDSEENPSEMGISQEGGERIMGKLFQAFDVLLTHVPEYAFDLLSTLAGIEYEVLMQQKIDDVFDIYDAIIEVNDVEKLVKRAKKSFALTKAQTKVMNHFQGKKEQELKAVEGQQ